MRIQLDNHLHLEEENGNWYLTSTESGKVAWKATISQLVCAWKRYCSLDHASDAPALQAELERYRKLAKPYGDDWMIAYKVEPKCTSRASLSVLAEAMEVAMATRDRIQELEGELASWKTGQHCAIQHVKKEYYESGLNDMADLRRRYAELEQELLSLKTTRDRAQELEKEVISLRRQAECWTSQYQKEHKKKDDRNQRIEELEKQNADLAQQLESAKKTRDEITEKWTRLDRFVYARPDGVVMVRSIDVADSSVTELLTSRDEAANHIRSGRERLERIAAQATTIAAQKSELALYEERLRISNGRVYLRNGVGETLDGVLEQRRLLKEDAAELQRKLAEHPKIPTWASVGVVNDEFWVYFKGVQCCVVTPDGAVKSTGKALWRSAHTHSYRDVESALNAFEKATANAKETEALLEGVRIARGDKLSVTYNGNQVQWWADTVKVWAHDTTWYDKDLNPHQVASLVADVETLKRELALARPTWQQWVERIKASPGFKCKIAEGEGTAVWACLGACAYFPSSKARELLDMPDIQCLDNMWQVWTHEVSASAAIRATKQWAEKAKKQKVQE